MIEHSNHLNQLVQELEANPQDAPRSKQVLIREAFVLWHMLSEGAACENYSEKDLQRLLKRNFETFQQYYIKDTDYSFITGWMMQVAFWHFRSPHDESYGNQLLLQAYGNAPGNSLFKWSVRQDLRLPEREVSRLQQDICGRFDEFYNYGRVIRDYFVNVVKGA